MLRRSPRTVLLRAAALVVAVATAVWVARAMGELDRKQEALGRAWPTVVARTDLPAGSRIRAADVVRRTVRGVTPQPAALTRVGDAVGRVVTVPVLRGATVTARNLASRTRDGSDGVVPPGQRAMRVSVPGALAPAVGDAVDAYVTFPSDAVPADVDPTLTVAAGVRVIDVDRDRGAREQSVAVTVLVTEPEAKRLAYATANGMLALAVVPPEDAASRTAGSRR
jgi:Flp pilus assembly protein CpaB